MLEQCECEETVQIALINQDADLGTTSGGTYYIGDFNFSMEFISKDITGDGQNETYLNFHTNTNSGTDANFTIELPSGINCACPIEEWVFDETAFVDYVVNLPTALLGVGFPPGLVNFENLGTILGANNIGSIILNYFNNNGFFEDCNNSCYDLNLTTTSGLGISTTYDLAACEEPCRTEFNVTFGCDSCDTYNRFENWVADVAPGSFDPFQFFKDNFQISLVDCNNTQFAEVNITSVDYSVGDGYYTTYQETLRFNLPEDFCIDDFVELVVDPKVIYQAYQDSCYQYGYDMFNLPFGEDELHLINTKTDAEYQFGEVDGSLAIVPADCEEAICINLVNEYCLQQELRVSNLEASFNDGGCGCCGGECDTQYDIKAETFTLSFNLAFIHTQASGEIPGETIIHFHYSIGAESGTFEIEASALGLGCTNPIVNLIFDETDLINSLTGDSKDLINFFVSNGMFEDCEGNCYEIFPRDIGDEGASPYVLQACTDCTNTPITVSIDDCCNQEVAFTAEAANEITDADKLAFFQNLYNLEYVNCNGASFVEFTYFYNNSEEGCQYNSFPACCETIRITVPEYVEGYGCDNGSSTIKYDISEILPDNDDIASLINHLKLDCDFISFFDNYFTDYCGNISYNIPGLWGDKFLSYLQNSNSTFTAENGICYQLTTDECGNLVLGLAFEPIVLHDTAVSSNSFESTFLVVDCGDCDEQPFLLGLSNDEDSVMGNELFVGQHIVLPEEFDSDCVIDPCSFDLTEVSQGSGILQVVGFSFDVTCGEDGYVYQYTGTDANGSWNIIDAAFEVPVVLDLTGNGIQLSNASQSGVQYDMNGDGVKDQVGWLGEGNGLLVYDVNNDSTVTNASEFVLTDHVPGAKTDLEALRMGFDTNQDNTLDQQDSAWNQFGVWQDANQDAIVDNGEYHTLAQLGIVSIDLASQGTEQSVNGNIVHGVSSFAFADGSTGTVADVALRYLDGAANSVHNDTTVTDPAVSNPTVAEQSHVVMAQNDPVVQSAVEQLANQAAVASA